MDYYISIIWKREKMVLFSLSPKASEYSNSHSWKYYTQRSLILIFLYRAVQLVFRFGDLNLLRWKQLQNKKWYRRAEQFLENTAFVRFSFLFFLRNSQNCYQQIKFSIFGTQISKHDHRFSKVAAGNLLTHFDSIFVLYGGYGSSAEGVALARKLFMKFFLAKCKFVPEYTNNWKKLMQREAARIFRESKISSEKSKCVSSALSLAVFSLWHQRFLIRVWRSEQKAEKGLT